MGRGGLIILFLQLNPCENFWGRRLRCMPYHPFCRTIVIQNEDIEKGFHCIYGNKKSNLLCVHQPIGKFGWYLPIFELNSTSHPEDLGHTHKKDPWHLFNLLVSNPWYFIKDQMRKNKCYQKKKYFYLWIWSQNPLKSNLGFEQQKNKSGSEKQQNRNCKVQGRI